MVKQAYKNMTQYLNPFKRTVCGVFTFLTCYNPFTQAQEPPTIEQQRQYYAKACAQQHDSPTGRSIGKLQLLVEQLKPYSQSDKTHHIAAENAGNNEFTSLQRELGSVYQELLTGVKTLKSLPEDALFRREIDDLLRGDERNLHSYQPSKNVYQDLKEALRSVHHQEILDQGIKSIKHQQIRDSFANGTPEDILACLKQWYSRGVRSGDKGHETRHKYERDEFVSYCTILAKQKYLTSIGIMNEVKKNGVINGIKNLSPDISGCMIDTAEKHLSWISDVLVNEIETGGSLLKLAEEGYRRLAEIKYEASIHTRINELFAKIDSMLLIASVPPAKENLESKLNGYLSIYETFGEIDELKKEIHADQLYSDQIKQKRNQVVTKIQQDALGFYSALTDEKKSTLIVELINRRRYGDVAQATRITADYICTLIKIIQNIVRHGEELYSGLSHEKKKKILEVIRVQSRSEKLYNYFIHTKLSELSPDKYVSRERDVQKAVRPEQVTDTEVMYLDLSMSQDFMQHFNGQSLSPIIKKITWDSTKKNKDMPIVITVHKNPSYPGNIPVEQQSKLNQEFMWITAHAQEFMRAAKTYVVGKEKANADPDKKRGQRSLRALDIEYTSACKKHLTRGIDLLHSSLFEFIE